MLIERGPIRGRNLNVLGVAELFVCGFSGPKLGARLSRGETAANSISVLLDCQREKRQYPIWTGISGCRRGQLLKTGELASMRFFFAKNLEDECNRDVSPATKLVASGSKVTRLRRSHNPQS